MVKAAPGSPLAEGFEEFKLQISGFLASDGPNQLSKDSLMLAIENLRPESDDEGGEEAAYNG